MAWANASKPSAWSTQVDDEEASGDKGLAPLPAAFAAQADTAFPSLGDAVKVVESKADKKKKAAKMSLADFNSLGSGGGASSGKFTVGAARARSQQKDFDEVVRNLPRAPRADRDEDDSSGPSLGGGFQGYGGNRGGFGDREERTERRGFGDRDRRGGFGDRDDASQASDDGPSRADMADDWGSSRKFTPSSGNDRADDRGERRGFGSGGFADREPRRGFGDGGFDRAPVEDAGPSRADMADNWGANRAALPEAPRGGSAFGERRSGGGGFADRDGFRDRRDSDLFSSRADDSGTWGRRTTEASSAPSSASGGERPRLKLAPRTLPAPVIKKEEEPAPAAEEEKAAVEEEVPASRPKPRSNPFGAARPREEVLAEKTKSDTSAAGSCAGSEHGAATTEYADKPAAVDGDLVEQAVQEAQATLAQANIEA